MNFFSRLELRIRQVDSLLCIGLDPHRSDLPEFTADSAKAFCLRLIESTADFAAAFKPNAAFFEVFGPAGIAALQEVIAAVPEGIPVILDAKRGDIASTARAYAQTVFKTLGADAVTLNPYLGYDAVEPFLSHPAKGAFVLCKTSNPGAGDLQDLLVAADSPSPSLPAPPPRPVYWHVARLARRWNGRGNLGLVVGATQAQALAHVRAAAPDLWILAPGVGAQGGDLAAALRAGLRADGLGMLIPVSRGIARAEHPRRAARNLREAINRERSRVGRSAPTSAPTAGGQVSRTLPDALLEAGCIRFGRFTLKSGVQSPIYIDLRRLVAYPALLAGVADAYSHILRALTFDHLAALPYAALPIASAISLRSGWPMLYPRKEPKAYGTRAAIEGVFRVGERAVVIDDLISTGGSKFEGIAKLESAGLTVQDVVVLIDRRPAGQRGARIVSGGAQRSYRLHAVFTLLELLEHYQRSGAVDAAQAAEVRAFLR